MIPPTSRTPLVILAFVIVSGLAIAGWMRKNDRPAETAFVGSQPVATMPNGPIPQPTTSYTQAPQFDSAPLPYSEDGYYPTRMRPVYVRQQESRQEFVEEPAQPQYVTRPAPRVEYYTDSRGVRHHGRSKTHSVEIVAGTAAVGAAIGGIAGGGKGAAIGAISGGGAGFAYDRLTHNK